MTTSPAESITFTCGSCGFHARLAQHYQGKAIRCPGCEAPQLVGVAANPPAMQRPAAAAPEAAGAGAAGAGKVAFDCISCGHHAEISSEYAGKVVWCPGCNAVRIVPHAEAASPVPRKPRIEKAAEGGFSCQACGFHSRAIPSGVNGVVYCLACRAPQPMVAGLDASVLAPIDPAEPTHRDDGIDPRSHTPIGLLSPFTPDEQATLDAVSATSKADQARSEGDIANIDYLIEPVAPAPAKAKVDADAAQTAETQKIVIRPAAPKPPTRDRVKPEAKHTSTVNVVQKGVRKVYRSVDAKADVEQTASDEAREPVPASARSGGKPGLFGRLSSKFFKKKG